MRNFGKPASANISQKETIIVTVAITPNASGEIIRAKIILVTGAIILAEISDINDHFAPLINLF